MISKNKELGVFVCTLTALVCDVASFGRPISADETYRFCGAAKVFALYTKTLRTLNNSTKQKIVVTDSTQYTSERNKRKITLVAIGPSFTSADSFEVNNSTLTCTDQGFSIVTKITRSSAFNGSLDRNMPWQPRTEVTFASTKNKSIIVNLVWKMMLDTGEEINHDISDPKQIFPMSVKKVIR